MKIETMLSIQCLLKTSCLPGPGLQFRDSSLDERDGLPAAGLPPVFDETHRHQAPDGTIDRACYGVCAVRSLTHQTLVELFRERPSQAPALLDEVLHIPLPVRASVAVVEADLDQLVPTEFRGQVRQ